MTLNQFIGDPRQRDPRGIVLALVTIAAAIAAFSWGCASGGGIPIDPDVATRVACLAAGGIWDVDARTCRLPEPPDQEPEEPPSTEPEEPKTPDDPLADVAWCHELEPPATCSSAAVPCKHQPPGEAPELAPACPEEPAPPDTEPGPAGCPVEPQLVDATCSSPLFHDAIRAATTAIGNRAGTPRERQDAVAASLETPDRCVISGKEAIFVERPDGLYGEYHVVHSSQGTWTNSGRGKWIGCHAVGGQSHQPGPGPGCQGCSMSSFPAFVKFSAACPKKHGNWWDCAALFGDAAYCKATGQPNKVQCPIQPEGHPERAACELCALGGPPLWRCSVGDVAHPPNANPWLAACADDAAQWIEICVPDGSKCRRRGF